MSKTYDYVIGMADTTAVITNPKARLSATVQSLLLSELLLIWQNDDLTLEIVLDIIEEMDKNGWEPTLRWLGHFYTWESFRDDWHMTVVEQEIYAIEKSKRAQTLEKTKDKQNKGEK